MKKIQATHMLKHTHTHTHTPKQTEADTRYFMNIKQIKWKVYKINYAKRKIKSARFILNFSKQAVSHYCEPLTALLASSWSLLVSALYSAL